MVRVYLLRHCETEENALHVFQGTTDTRPSEVGEFQLEKTAERFKNENIDAIYTSDLYRAFRTGEVISKYHDAPVIKLCDLREIDMGLMTGMKLSDVAKTYPEESKNWNEKPHLFNPPQGEPMKDVNKRVIKAFNKIISENEGKTVIIISHGCALRNIICHCFEKPFEKLGEVIIGHNTAVTMAEVTENNIKVVYHADATHLGISAEDSNKPIYTL